MEGTAYESADGKYIYYVKQYFSSDLWKMPVNGGEESRVLPSVVSRAFLPVKDGIYFIRERAADAKFSIQFLSLATGIVNTVSTMSGPQARDSPFRRMAVRSCSPSLTKPVPT